MQLIDIDYSAQGKKWPVTLTLVFLALTLLACVLVAQHNSHLNETQAALDIKQAAGGHLTREQSAPDLSDSIASAHQLEHTLNVHWLGVLDALEQVHANNPAIMLKGIHPQLTKAKLSLTGEAHGFDAITQYIHALESMNIFNDVALHRQSNSDDRPGTIVFVINMGWQQ